MIRYIDWAQTVLRVVLEERPSYQQLTIGQLAEGVGLSLGGSESDAVLLCLDHVLRDLAPHGLVKYEAGGYMVGYPPAAPDAGNHRQMASTIKRQIRAN